jgi:hypothetical protein
MRGYAPTSRSRHGTKGQFTDRYLWSVAWWPDSGARLGGHVAYVEQVNSPTPIIISEAPRPAWTTTDSVTDFGDTTEIQKEIIGRSLGL